MVPLALSPQVGVGVAPAISEVTVEQPGPPAIAEAAALGSPDHEVALAAPGDVLHGWAYGQLLHVQVQWGLYGPVLRWSICGCTGSAKSPHIVPSMVRLLRRGSPHGCRGAGGAYCQLVDSHGRQPNEQQATNGLLCQLLKQR